jgi:indole-3-glycerol phosphate synthase
MLDQIISHKRIEVAAARARRPLAEVRAACRDLPAARDFVAALRPAPPARVRLIAEVKRASPSKGVMAGGLDPVRQARTYAAAGAAAVSVLTDQKYFHGTLDDLIAVRAAVDVPVLRKEFVIDEYQLWEARAAGADAILLIVAALDRSRLRDLFHAAKGVGLAALVEAHTAAELDEAVAIGSQVIGINNRNLQTLETSLAPSLALLPRVPPGALPVSESGIFTAADVAKVAAAGAQAILVGEALVRAADVAATVRELSS